MAIAMTGRLIRLIDDQQFGTTIAGEDGVDYVGSIGFSRPRRSSARRLPARSIRARNGMRCCSRSARTLGTAYNARTPTSGRP